MHVRQSHEMIGRRIKLSIRVCGVAGQPIDSASNGRAPLPWEIHCHPTQMFHDETHLIEVPHTAAIAVYTSVLLVIICANSMKAGKRTGSHLLWLR